MKASDKQYILDTLDDITTVLAELPPEAVVQSTWNKISRSMTIIERSFGTEDDDQLPENDINNELDF